MTGSPDTMLWSGATLASIGAVLGIATVSTAIAVPLLFRVNRQVGPVATSTVTFLNPIFGVLWGALFLHEAVTPTLLAGGLLVFVALGLILDIRPLRLLRARAAAAS
jgi:drug/metabolite transporter (DMT)-like permease